MTRITEAVSANRNASSLNPLSITGEKDFRHKLKEAEESIAAGHIQDASLISCELRQKYLPLSDNTPE